MDFQLEEFDGTILGMVHWDEEAGTIDGPEKDTILELIAESVDDGDIVGHPYPTVYTVTDPLHIRRDMALVIGKFWKMPVILAPYYPKTARGRRLDGDVVF